MSTLDSLFQRLGRCYRSREYDKTEPNVYVYTKNSSGVKYVYDEDIHEKSKELLKEYDERILTEQTKVDLVDKLYSKEMLKNTRFLEKFKEGMRVLNNIVDYDVTKSDSQKLLRNIDNTTVIPKTIYDENWELFKEFENCKDNKMKNKIRRKINELTTSISKSQERRIKENISDNPYIKEIKTVNLKYDKNIGLILEKDEEYEWKERML